MADERTDTGGKGDGPPAQGGEKSAHAGPTIDLDASQVTDKTEADKAEAEETEPHSAPDGAPRAAPASRGPGLLLAGLSGGAAALAVAGGLWAWFDGFAPAQRPATVAQLDGMAANVEALAARLAKAEAAAARPVSSADADLARRAEAAEAALAAMRDELAAMRARIEAAGSALDELKAARTPSAAADAARIEERLGRAERATQALQAQVAKRDAPTTEDVDARRLAVAGALDLAVSRGEPFADRLAAAKRLAADAQALGALEAYAAKGVPGETVYLRRIVAILEQTDQAGRAGSAPPAAAAVATEAGLLDRLQAGLAKLVRIERSDAPAAAPQRALPALDASDDLSAVRRDVASLPQAARPEIQAWLKSVEARDAALAASRAFADDALAAIVKSGQ